MIVQDSEKLVSMFDIELNQKNVSVATSEIQDSLEKLKAIKSHLKFLEEQEQVLCAKIKEFMGDHEVLVTQDGLEAATYKSYEGGMKLHVDTLREIFPQIYKDCLAKAESFRRFCIK
jgi:predicted phage-related endonuclease